MVRSFLMLMREKTLEFELNNDTVREQIETLILDIFDPLETSQIEQGTAYARIRDDDPSTPEIENPISTYSLSEGRRLISNP